MFVIFHNLARTISPNYEANEIKLGRLGPQLFRESENLVALGRSVREVGCSKLPIFKSALLWRHLAA